ncbi:serine hydrolase [Agromyces humi]|uniref:serine hydrolase n=1 Tax=Agromyces humi TaxID=1766800 RepID=UPI00135BA08D|nr:serine hydrolase [Agromyces humi]
MTIEAGTRLADAFGAHDEGLHGVSWSAAVVDVDRGVTLLERDAHRVQRTASIGKLFLLVEVARQAEAGELDLDELVRRRPDEFVADSGVWYRLRTDELSIHDACALIGAVSDNLATNVLVRRLGIERIAETSRSLGFHDSALLDRVREERGPEHPPTLSRGSARELVDLAARLERGELVSPGVCRMVVDWLALDTDLSMVASAFGLDPLAHTETDRGIRLWNKTGTISTARIDVGVAASTQGRIAWAVLADWEGATTDPRDAVLSRMRVVGDEVRALLGG